MEVRGRSVMDDMIKDGLLDGKKEKCQSALIRIPTEIDLGNDLLPKIEVVTKCKSKSEEEEIEKEDSTEVEKAFDWEELLYALLFGLLPSAVDILSDFRLFIKCGDELFHLLTSC